MEQQVAQTKRPRNPRNRPKLNTAKVDALVKQGLTPPQIAKVVDCHHTTVWRYLREINPENQALAQFKSGRGDVLALIQGKAINLLDKVIGGYTDDELTAMTASSKTGLIASLNAVTGTLYDKERLERGQSTDNVAVIGVIRQLQEMHRAPVPQDRGQAATVEADVVAVAGKDHEVIR